MTAHTTPLDQLPAWAHAVADNVAAYALERRERKEVVVWHPCSCSHPNAQAAAARYEARGWTVQPRVESVRLDD